MSKEMHDFLGGDDFAECNCHSFENELVDRGDGNFQVVCGCGVSGPIGPKGAAIHEWNMITAAAGSNLSAAQLISLWCIEKSREQGKDESMFIESLKFSLGFGELRKAELLESMGLAVKE